MNDSAKCKLMSANTAYVIKSGDIVITVVCCARLSAFTGNIPYKETGKKSRRK
jgi:hypothetical protein